MWLEQLCDSYLTFCEKVCCKLGSGFESVSINGKQILSLYLDNVSVKCEHSSNLTTYQGSRMNNSKLEGSEKLLF